MSDTSGPAFPGETSFPLNPESHFYGLTKRELFAAMALQGLLVHREVHKLGSSLNDAQLDAVLAVGRADALLRELEKK